MFLTDLFSPFLKAMIRQPPFTSVVVSFTHFSLPSRRSEYRSPCVKMTLATDVILMEEKSSTLRTSLTFSSCAHAPTAAANANTSAIMIPMMFVFISVSVSVLPILHPTWRPSKKRTVRLVCLAWSSLCVTMTMVRLSSSFN